MMSPRATRKTSKFAPIVARYAVMIGVLVIMLIPFAWMFGSAFRPVTEIFAYVQPVTWKTFVPVNVTFKNFADLLFGPRSFWPRYIFNSLFVSFWTVALGTLINALAGYGFARLRFRGRELAFLIVLATMIMPFEAIALPLYLVVKNLGWLDSYQALIVPILARGFNIFLLRQFFLGLPAELEEAAFIDGASRLRIFFQVAVPLSRAAIVTTILISFQWSWDQFIWPLIVTNSPKFRVIQVAISNLVGMDAAYWNELFAAVALAALIPLTLFLMLQRYYVEGISTTGMKG